MLKREQKQSMMKKNLKKNGSKTLPPQNNIMKMKNIKDSMRKVNSRFSEFLESVSFWLSLISGSALTASSSRTLHTTWRIQSNLLRRRRKRKNTRLKQLLAKTTKLKITRKENLFKKVDPETPIRNSSEPN